LLGAPGASKWHAWSVTSPAAISYRICSSRSAAAARAVLGDYQGIAVVDGYSAYKTLRDERAESQDGPPPFTLAFCWTHARRRFVEAEPHYPQATELTGRCRGRLPAGRKQTFARELTQSSVQER